MKLNNKKGISLIVLVITIAVMIILAAAIILSLQSSGIIGRANEAKAKSDSANAKQLVSVAQGEWQLMTEEEQKEKGSLKAYINDKLNQAGIPTTGNGGVSISESGALHTIYVGADNKQAIIPEGYTVSDASAEDSVSEGLVIYEGDEKVTNSNVLEAQKTRNQFVWVPVDDINEFVKINWDTASDVVSNYGFDRLRSYATEDEEAKKEYTAMYDSIKTYGGFYIARYEAGKGESNAVVSRKGTEVLMTYGTVGDKCTSFSNNSVVGHLIYGEEWDAALNFISEKDSAYPISTDGTGNYSTSLLPTGSNDSYARNNIYDMAGNAWEVTSEYILGDWNSMFMADSFIYRGGCYDVPSTMIDIPFPAAEREREMGPYAEAFMEASTIRVALYLK